MRYLHSCQSYVTVIALTMLLGAAVLTGCQALGVATPQTFDEKVYATQLAVDKVVVQATAMTNAHVITPKDARNIADLAQAAKDGIDLARSVATTNGPTAGNARLEVAIATLTAAQAYLMKMGAKP